MQPSEIAGYVGKIIGYREGHQQILPQSVYLLSEKIFGSQRDLLRHRVVYTFSERRQEPKRAAGRMAWAFGWPVIALAVSTGSQMVEAHRFLAGCSLTPADVFEINPEGILTIRQAVLPRGLKVQVIPDHRMLIAPTGKDLSGTQELKIKHPED